jgi:imidazolonepropionase-like amidohydrolase
MLRALLLLSLSAAALAQSPETGTFRLHKFEQPIGEETYTLARTGDTLTLNSDFKFTDRRTPVPLHTQALFSADYTPKFFSIDGNTSRQSTINDDVTVQDGTATVRTGKSFETVRPTAPFFSIAGYAPVAIEQSLMRYWTAHGKPASLSALPSGTVQVALRGDDTISVKGQAHHLQRYSLRGVAWGLETLWMDGDNLAALVTRDAEFDHFEAVRESYEPALQEFVTSAAKDEMSELADISRSLKGRRTGTLVFTGATLIDGTDRSPVPNATVISRDGRIVYAGPSAGAKLPRDATTIDVRNKFIIPGLWDMHAHYEQVEWGPIYLAAGVTTVRDVGNELEFITSVRDAIRAGRGVGPDLLLAGVVDGSGPMSLGVEKVDSPGDAAQWVQRYHDAGFQQMKIYSSVKDENVKAICEDAHKLGMTVTGHIPEGMDIYQGVNDGMDSVNHFSYVLDVLTPKGPNGERLRGLDGLKARANIDPHSAEARKLFAFLKQHGTVLDDTLALFELFTLSTDQLKQHEPGVLHVAPELRAQLLDNEAPPADIQRVAAQGLEKEIELLGEAQRAGIPFVAGTDQAVPGYSVYRELELYVQAGFTPLEALHAATTVPANFMKVRDRGTVETGKRADFDILDANPLENIHNIRTVRQVVANGVLYDSAPLWQSVGFER